jgi:hypothetical protein
VHVFQLLDPLVLTPHIEVVVAILPERLAWLLAKLTRSDLLQHLQHHGEIALLGFTHKQVNVLGHDHITVNVKPLPLPHRFQNLLEQIESCRSAQQWSATIATEGDEMEVSCFLKPL